MLTFASDHQRQQAEQLMQPALIRVVDNLRKRLETSSWRGDYQEQLLWPATATAAQKQRAIDLRQQLDAADPERTAAIQTELAQLPAPYPSYDLHLHQEGQPPQVISVWQLCSRACFLDYADDDFDRDQAVTVDATLIDAEGEVDWRRLDEKVIQLIDAVFPPGEAGAHLSE